MIGIKKKPVSILDAEDRLDLVDILKTGPVGHNHTPEQERNFDAGYTPSSYQPKFIREEVINGKRYKVYQA